MADHWQTAPTSNEAGASAGTWGASAAAPTDRSDAGAEWGSGGDEQAATDHGKPLASEHVTATMNKDDLLTRAKVAGWTEKTAFNYDEFKRQGGNDTDWHGAAKVYEWKDEYGDVGPRVEELEKVLFGGEFLMRVGDHLKNLEYSVVIEGPEKLESIKNFADAGLHPVVMKNIELARYRAPTAIQQYTIPYIVQGHDVVAVAQTGSGKTAAYLIPILSRLMGKARKLSAPKPNVLDPTYNPRLHRVKAEPLVVVVVPTRELAIQIFDEARRMCYRSMLRPCVVYGGLPMSITIEELGKGCDILIATPGRLCDMMDKPHILTMSRVKFTVIDEADEMLDASWEDELKKIMSGGDTNEDADHQYLMFSATFPKGARALARQYMSQDHVRIKVGRPGSSHKNIRQCIVYVDEDEKRRATYDLLFGMQPGRTLIFCNSKMTVDLLDDYLYNAGLPTTSIHADRNQREREDALRAFRTGRAPILIATGVSARGWDIKDVKHIINYDLPSGMYGGINEYIHRIGRTARIGHKGLATSFYNDRNEDLAQELVNVLVECECEVPDFLSQYMPEAGKIMFADDTDDEADAAEAGDGLLTAASGWSAAPEDDKVNGGGFTADTGFRANGEDVAAPAAW